MASGDDITTACQDVELLTSAVAVTCAIPQLVGLDFVAQSVSAFLDRSLLTRTLEDAVKANDMRLLRRLIATAKHKSVDATPARRYPLSLRFHIVDAAKIAAMLGHLDVLKMLRAANPQAVGDSDVFVAAAGSGNLDVIQWMDAHCSIGCDDDGMKMAIEQASRSGHVHVLEWIVKNRGLSARLLSLAFEYAVNDGHLSAVKWLSNWIVGARVPADMMDEVARRGDLDMIKWLDRHATIEFSIGAIDGAARSGHLEVIEWLHANRQSGCTYQASSYAAWCGRFEVVKWLYAHYPEKTSEDDIAFAAEDGHFEIVKFLLDCHQKKEESSAFEHHQIMDRAVLGGNLGIVKFLHEYDEYDGDGSKGCSEAAMDWAAAKGHLDVVKFLHENRSEGCTTSAMDEAAGNGHLHVVEFLQTHRAEGCTTRAMDLAASRNHVEVVRFLHEYRDEGCTVDALDWAAQQGFLETVHWLHANRSEGCRMDAMDGAAAGGHLEIVKFLHLNRREGCTTHAMDSAAGAGHLDVVKRLHENRSEGCTTDAMDYAAAAGHLDVVQWLHENRSEGCTDSAVNEALKRGDIKIADFLHAHRSEEVETHDILWKHVASLHWLYEHYPDKCNLKAIQAYAEEFRERSILQWLEDIGVLRASRELDTTSSQEPPGAREAAALSETGSRGPGAARLDAPVLEIDAHIEHDADHDSDLRDNEKQHRDCREPDSDAPSVLCRGHDGVKCDDPVHPQQTRTDAEAAVIPVQEITHAQVSNGDLERQERAVEREQDALQ